ncbi:zinc finger protein ZFP2-like [Sitodiplosis mosellana]|uniref:zinc finger protein ZFP2-like n=1 Tax=Sitodiplosis mosellana TaxID=263140 RepID=UPI002444AB93|nr:zinc finger protein ZFP2-like [Sitodiplosis mosellana]
MDTANSSKICRICCNQRLDDLVYLLNADNKTIVKKLRACADITIEHDDLLPKYICKKCVQKLDCAYNFKIQCEYMDQKLRETIASMLQKQINLPLSCQTEALPSYEGSDEDSSYAYDLEQNIMDDVIEEECIEEEQSMEDIAYYEHGAETDQVQDAAQLQVQPSFQFDALKNDMDSNVMEISQKIAELEKFDSLGSLPSAKDPVEDCVDQEMFSVKSENESSPKAKQPFKCETCEATFSIHSEYNKHTKTHGKNRFQCLVCNKWFAKRYLLNAHQKTHTGAKNYECLQCQKRYTSQSNLDRHIRVFHHQERLYKCSTCLKTFSQLSILKLHQSVHMAERKFSCDICDNKFKTEVHLKLHKKRHMPTDYRRPRRKYTPPKKIYKPTPKLCVCNECGKRFTSLALLRSHMQSHSLEKKYECTYCKKRFSFQQTLRNHVFLHTGEKRFKCDICHISFRQIGHLQGHKLIHSGQKPHTCSVCNKAFALRGNLTVHMRTHAGATPYQCIICPKKFSDSNGLRRHHMVHQRKNETTAAIEQILMAPTIEAAQTEPTTIMQQSVFENAIMQQPIFASASDFNVVNPEIIQFITSPDIAGDNSQIIFKTQ